MHLSLHRFDLPTRHPFTISRGTTTVQRTVIVELEQDGVSGYGEAPECAFYGATIERIVAALERVRPVVETSTLPSPADRLPSDLALARTPPEPVCGRGAGGECCSPRELPSTPATPPAAIWSELAPHLPDDSFALCALDAAAHDLWGKITGQPVWRLWGLALDRCPPSDYTIGIDTIDVMVRKLAEFPGFPVYKVKLGTPHDIEIIRALRQHTAAPLRVDANCAWGVDETLRNAEALATLGVQYIEQPLPRERWHEMEQLVARSALPLVADESCQVEDDVARCAGRFHGINIKLVKCGGLTPARRMIDHARQLGLKIMIGCFTESTVGISAIAQLLPLIDYADIDGALLLAGDVADGVQIDRGRVLFPATPGCGVTLRT